MVRVNSGWLQLKSAGIVEAHRLRQLGIEPCGGFVSAKWVKPGDE